MSWNYRIIERKEPTIPGQKYYQIFEVFYDKDGNQSGYADDFGGLVGEDIEDLKGGIELMLRAFDASVIKEEDLK